MKKLLLILLLVLNGTELALAQALTTIDSVTVFGGQNPYSPELKATASQVVQMQGKIKDIDNNSQRRYNAVSSKLDNLGSRLDSVDQSIDSIGEVANELSQTMLLAIQKMDSITSKVLEPPTDGEADGQSRSVWPILSMIAGLLTLAAMLWGYRKLRGEISIVRNQEGHSASPQNEDISQILSLLRAGQSRNDGISESVASSLSSLSRQEDTMTKVATQLETVLNAQDKAELIEKLEALLSGFDEIKASIDKLPSSGSKPDNTQTAPILPQRDVVIYNAAVDAWLHINNQLFSMGKWRWKIQNVYRLLAGLDVSEEDLRSDLQGLGDDERRESVLTIINDIKRFMATHKPVIDEWLQGENEAGIKSLQDAVWMSQGLPFNDDRDEEVTGDSVENGAIVDKVASLGYYFPGSRNGGILQKCKVLVK